MNPFCLNVCAAGDDSDFTKSNVLIADQRLLDRFHGNPSGFLYGSDGADFQRRDNLTSSINLLIGYLVNPNRLKEHDYFPFLVELV